MRRHPGLPPVIRFPSTRHITERVGDATLHLRKLQATAPFPIDTPRNPGDAAAAPDPLMDALLTEKRKRRRKRWRRFLASVALLLVALVVWSLDEPPPEVSDLLPTLRKLPDDQNAYLVLAKADALVKWNLADLSAEDQEVFEAMMHGNKWDPAKAAICLAPFGNIWPLVAKAAALKSAQAPILHETEPFAYHGYIDMFRWPASQMQNLFKLSVLHAWQLCHEEHTDSGLDWLLTSLRTAQLLQESRGGADSYWSGSFARDTIQEALIAMAGRKDASPTVLRRALLVLTQTRPKTDEFTQNLRATFQTAIRTLDFANQDRFATLSSFSLFRYRLYLPLIFKPNQDQRVLADLFRDAIKLTNTDHAAINTWQDKVRNQICQKGWLAYSPNNFIGRELIMDSNSCFELINMVGLRWSPSVGQRIG